MSGLVLELQRDALDKSINVSDLLRKAVVVSKKLGINEIEEWINRELAGYPDDESEIPLYREITGRVMAYNPYHGWRPLHFENHKLGDKLSKRKISQAVGQIDAIANNDKSGELQVPFSNHIKNQLMDSMNIPLDITLLVGDSELHKILEGVRNEILNWTLDLETRGIVGDGMRFSREEKQAASQINYQIVNNIGSIQNSQLQQDSSNATQSLNVVQTSVDLADFIENLKKSIPDLNLESEDLAELEAEVSTIENQLSSPKPKNVIISESLKSARNILEGAAGSIIATKLLEQLANIM